jgi:malate permease and related proteins
VSDVVSILLQVFLLIGLGLVVRWRRILPRDQTVQIFNAAVINLTLPATVFLGLMNIRELSWSLVKIPLIAVIVICASGVVAWLVTRRLRLRRATAGAVIITSMCGSTGFFGTPIFGALARSNPDAYGQTVGMAALYSEIGSLIPLLTIVAIIAAWYGEKQEFTAETVMTGLFRFLPFVALLIGFAFWPETHGGRFPEALRGTLGFLSQATVMLAMLALGMTITIRDFSQYLRSVLSVNAIKLIFAPALAIVLAAVFALEPQARFVVIFESALPAIVIAIAYANQYKLDVELASTAVFTTFVFSLVTLPIFAVIAA